MSTSLKPDTDGVHAIANTGKDNIADIVFIHGLSGKSHGTWRYGEESESDHFFWPEALGEDLKQCSIWTVGYPAGITEMGNPGMSIRSRANNIALKLTSAGIGQRPLIFIPHSMGGLIAKSLIETAESSGDRDRMILASKLKGIVFCATPHRGADAANAAQILGKFLGGSQTHVNEMKANEEGLDFLNTDFLEWHRKHPIPILSFVEKRKLLKKFLFWRIWPLPLVVPQASADIGIAGSPPKPVDYDHIDIVKPDSKYHDVYNGVLKWINKDVLPHQHVDNRNEIFPRESPQFKLSPTVVMGSPFTVDMSSVYEALEGFGRNWPSAKIIWPDASDNLISEFDKAATRLNEIGIKEAGQERILELISNRKNTLRKRELVASTLPKLINRMESFTDKEVALAVKGFLLHTNYHIHIAYAYNGATWKGSEKLNIEVPEVWRKLAEGELEYEATLLKGEFEKDIVSAQLTYRDGYDVKAVVGQFVDLYLPQNSLKYGLSRDVLSRWLIPQLEFHYMGKNDIPGNYGDGKDWRLHVKHSLD